MFIIFPGQGSQKKGMGKQFEHINEVEYFTKIAQEITNKDVDFLLNEADDETLKKTENAQIAIFIMNHALAKHFIKNGGEITMLAGHSLGQYNAMALAGVLEFEEACQLIQKRCDAMADVDGKMLALLGVNINEAHTIACLASTSDSYCFVANHNSSSQIVLSGTQDAITRASAIAKSWNKKAIILATSGPFHSPYMNNACQKLNEFIETLNFKEPTIPIISNIKATTNVNWKEETKNHMQAPVRWKETLEFANTDEIIEIGANSILANIAKHDGYNVRYFVEMK